MTALLTWRRKVNILLCWNLEPTLSVELQQPQSLCLTCRHRWNFELTVSFGTTRTSVPIFNICVSTLLEFGTNAFCRTTEPQSLHVTCLIMSTPLEFGTTLSVEQQEPKSLYFTCQVDTVGTNTLCRTTGPQSRYLTYQINTVGIWNELFLSNNKNLSPYI